MIDKNSIENLKNSIDIVDVLGNFIELKKSGANYKANCPFHGENTPSFVVSPTKQIYHCFGCGVGGDSIKFLMELEKLSYPEAIEKLASMNNFTLSYTSGGSNYEDTKRVLNAIQEFYIQNLHKNSVAVEYLHNRGINHNSIEKFGIGYVPNGREVLNFLNSNLLSLPKAVEGGILAQNDNGGGHYARLVERITFPIRSNSSAIVGFGGRTITNHPAKYINSPQTKLFNKSRLLYGYDLAKESIYKDKLLIVCEGYLDVVMFHQAGFTQAVASMGTALTNEHLPLLRKGEPKIILAYDGDKAGINAGIKASKMLSIAGFEGSIVLFANGADPADMIAEGKANEVSKLLREAKGFISFVLEMIAQSYDLKNPREKESAFGAMREYLENFSPIIKESYIPFASNILGVNPILFNSNTNLNDISEKIDRSRDDLGYLGMIKTMMEEPKYIDRVFKYLSLEMFGEYRYLMELLMRGERENSSLMALSIDENIKILTPNEFKIALLQTQTRYYKTKLQRLAKDENIPVNKRYFLIKKIKMQILPLLKKGELICDDGED